MLSEVKNNTPVNFKLLHRLINYQLFDIKRGDVQTMGELEIYAENTRSLMLYMNQHIFRIDDEKAMLAASHLGRCLGICDIIKKSPVHLSKSRNYMPQDLMLKVSFVVLTL